MAATREQMETEFAYFRDVWNFFKKHYDVRLDNAYWEAVIEEGSGIAQRYDNLPLCKDLILAVIDELERKYEALGAKHETA